MPGAVIEIEPDKADKLVAYVYAAYNYMEDAQRMLDEAAGVLMECSRKVEANDGERGER